MNEPGRYTVTPLEEGTLFSTKEMAADSGRALAKHRASVESVLIVIEGSCVLAMHGADQVMEVGDSRLIPADEWHQITANPAFRAVHIMPVGIEFEFDR